VWRPAARPAWWQYDRGYHFIYMVMDDTMNIYSKMSRDNQAIIIVIKSMVLLCLA